MMNEKKGWFAFIFTCFYISLYGFDILVNPLLLFVLIIPWFILSELVFIDIRRNQATLKGWFGEKIAALVITGIGLATTGALGALVIMLVIQSLVALYNAQLPLYYFYIIFVVIISLIAFFAENRKLAIKMVKEEQAKQAKWIREENKQKRKQKKK